MRHITLVDNGRVSYSNPARQCLFEYADCQARSLKAPAAAQALRRIFPDMRSEGLVLTIPMPGHPVSQIQTTGAVSGAVDETAEAGKGAGEVTGKGDKEVQEEVEEAAVRQLDELVRSHDVCFALTDSREARSVI